MKDIEIKRLEVTYHVCQEFYIPVNIDLEDKSQVKSYKVRNGILYITLINDKIIEIEGEDFQEPDYYMPDEFGDHIYEADTDIEFVTFYDCQTGEVVPYENKCLINPEDIIDEE